MADIPMLKKAERGRNVTAVLGPTNTGKTHLAIDRMLAHRTGLIGLPLRLLAREVYGRIVAKLGPDVAALITGEEKILPPTARYYVATVEAMPLDLDAEFVAIDEVQLTADLERGRVFTDRILRVRGRYETLLLGALTARGLLERLIPGLSVVTRPRMSVLTYSGEKKLTRLPPRSAVVAFSANEVYAIAELIRRQRGGAAIVMGALSPRTRNAQVELFQSGDVDFLIATDAIGMGLNLDVDHVAFASARKFDGYQFRGLSAAELGQIAGRAGRHTRDGTFGVTARVSPFPDELVEALETHAFQPAKVFQWRNPALDFSSLPALRQSLDEPAQEEGLTKAPPADDQKALEHALKSPETVDLADTPARVAQLWDVCQVPDYRKIAPANHADLILTLFGFLSRDGVIPDDWIARQVQYADKTDGDIDTLSNRIAHVRTWTFVANRNDWLADPPEWREATRKVEDRLSDALHERLMQRFVDRRTSVLMKRLRENAMLEAEVNDAGDVIVEGQHVGVLHGFRFHADAATGDPQEQKALRAAANKALAREMERRADRVAEAPDAAFALGSDAGLRWQGALIGKIVAGEDALKPTAVLLADETLPPPARERVQERLAKWLASHIEGLLKPLFDLKTGEGLEGGARGLAYRITEGFGRVERPAVAEEAKSLDQTARAGLRTLGVRFGAYHIFVPALLKPAPSQLLALLWALKHADLDVSGLQEVPQLSASGRTSIPVDPEIPEALYGVVGFRVCGPRAVRIDILERLADQIRPLVAWRPGPDASEPPPGAVPQGGAFLVTVAMTSLLGCSGEDFASVLTSLGYRVERREANAAERDALAAAQQIRKRVKQPRAPKLAGDATARTTPADGEGEATEALVAEVAENESSATAPEPAPMGVEPGGELNAEAAGAEPDDTLSATAAAAPAPAVAVGDVTQVGPDTEPARTSEAQDAAIPSAQSDGSAAAAAGTQDVSEAATPPDGQDAESAAAVAPEGTADPAENAAASGEAVASQPDETAEAGEVAEPDKAHEPSEAAEPNEPVVVEIWRVPRYQRGGEGARRKSRSPRGEGAGGQRRGGEGRQRQPAHAAQPRDAANDGAQTAERASASSPPHDAPPGSGEGRAKKGKKRKGREDKRPTAAKPPRREKQADPDSPFAALAALKQQMEKDPGDR
ncbi:MAG: helicase-related protein [Pseudomonadota bacterium]